MALKNICRKIYSILLEKSKDTERQMITFGIFGTIAYPLFSILNLHVLHPKIYENIFLRLIAGALCLGLALKNYWPREFKMLLPIYWYGTLLYALPFFFTFMMLKNNASNEWLLNLLTVLFFTILVIDWISAIFLFVIGGAIAVIGYYLTSNQPFVYLPQPINLKDFLGAYLVTIVLGILFSRDKELSEQNKLKTMKSLAAYIAHELRTPLGAIQSASRGINNYLPKLVDGYNLAKERNLPVKPIAKDILKILHTGVENISLEANHAGTIIDMLLTNIRHPEIKMTGSDTFSLPSSIDYAFSHYPFLPGQKEKIEWNNTSFNEALVCGDQTLFVHVIYNLIKNSLYFIEKSGKGKIFIWIENHNNSYILHFKDTGSGIAKKDLPYIFDRFFTKDSHQGTGIGLSFCKMVIDNMGGEIKCDSIEGEYTHFSIILEKTQNPAKIEA